MTVSKVVNKLADEIVHKTRDNEERRARLKDLRNSILQYVFNHDDYDYNDLDDIDQVTKFFDDYAKRFNELSNDGVLLISIYSNETGEVYTKLCIPYLAKEDEALCDMLDKLIIDDQADGYEF